MRGRQRRQQRNGVDDEEDEAEVDPGNEKVKVPQLGCVADSG